MGKSVRKLSRGLVTEAEYGFRREGPDAVSRKGKRLTLICGHREPKKGTSPSKDLYDPRRIRSTEGVAAGKNLALSAASEGRMRDFCAWEVFSEVSCASLHRAGILPHGADDVRSDTGLSRIACTGDLGRDRGGRGSI